MSQNRILQKAGWIDLVDKDYYQRRGPNGRCFCRWCSKEVPAGRRSFCGKECIHEWKIRSQPGYARKQVFKRDGGMCKLCSLDTEKIVKRLESIYYTVTYRRSDYEAALLELEEIAGSYPWAVPKNFRYNGNLRSLWHADHIKPVVEGGGECGLDNLRTLCVPCHKKETKALAARRADQKRKERDAQVHVPVPDPRGVSDQPAEAREDDDVR